LARYTQLLRARAAQPAFHPCGAQRVIDASPAVFAVQRGGPTGVLCLHNVSSRPQPFEAQRLSPGRAAIDVLTGQMLSADSSGRLSLTLAPYQVAWLKMADGSESLRVAR
jgi:hypothetical protein